MRHFLSSSIAPNRCDIASATETKYINKQPIDVAALRQRGKAAIAQRADGRYFANQLLKARQIDPKVIFISGWNDWAWCLQIEPAKEYGFKYVDMAARLLGREAETRPYRRSMNVLALAYSPDGSTLASADVRNAFRLWDVATGKNTLTLEEQTMCIGAVAFSPDGKILASGGWDTIVLWDVAAGILKERYGN
jgi:WD40 repeat protein